MCGGPAVFFIEGERKPRRVVRVCVCGWRGGGGGGGG